MIVTYEAKCYRPDLVHKRYVRAAWPGYAWCETTVGKSGRIYDIRQGRCEGADLPDDVREKADALAGTFPGYVDWPL